MSDESPTIPPERRRAISVKEALLELRDAVVERLQAMTNEVAPLVGHVRQFRTTQHKTNNILTEHALVLQRLELGQDKLLKHFGLTLDGSPPPSVISAPSEEEEAFDGS